METLSKVNERKDNVLASNPTLPPCGTPERGIIEGVKRKMVTCRNLCVNTLLYIFVRVNITALSAGALEISLKLKENTLNHKQMCFCKTLNVGTYFLLFKNKNDSVFSTQNVSSSKHKCRIYLMLHYFSAFLINGCKSHQQACALSDNHRH